MIAALDAIDWMRHLLNAVDLMGAYILFGRLPRREGWERNIPILLCLLLMEIGLRYSNLLPLALLLWGAGLLWLVFEVETVWDCLFMDILYLLIVRIASYVLCGVLYPPSMADMRYAALTIPLRLLLMGTYSSFMPTVSRTKKTISEYIMLIFGIVQMLFVQYSNRDAVNPEPVIRLSATVVSVGMLATSFSIFARMQQQVEEQKRMEIEEESIRQFRFIQYRSDMNEIVSRQYHDLRQQLQGLDAIANSEEMHIALRKLYGQIRGFETIHYTGSPMVDALLNEKAAEAQQKEVTLNIFMDLSESAFIDQLDLCAMVGNALDNAITAAAALDDHTCRRVTIKSTVLHGYLVIGVYNEFAGKLKRQGDIFLSTKPDANMHGKGITSIRYSASKYGGTCKTKVEGQRFTLEIFIPVSEKRSGGKKSF